MADLDGVVRIGTEIDSSGFEKGMKDLGNVAKKSVSGVDKQLEKTEKAVDSLGDESKSAANDVQKLEKNLSSAEKDVKSFGDSMEGASKTTSTFGDVLKASLLSDAIVGGIKLIGSTAKDMASDFINSASDVRAEVSQFEQTFGELRSVADEAIGRVADSSGILQTRINTLGSQIYAFSRSSGGEATESMDLMEKALQAAADSAAYYDRSIEDAAESLQSFLKGNYENDAALGLSATEATRNAAAMEMFGDKFNNLTEIQKQQTLLQMVLDAQELSGAMGQAAREADGWENVQGNLTEAWRQFQAALGEPLLDAVIPKVQSLTGFVQDLTSAFESGGMEGLLNELISNFSEFVPNLVESIINSAPLLSESVFSLFDVLNNTIIESAPTVLEQIGSLIDELFPAILERITSSVASLSEILPVIGETIGENLPDIASKALDMLGALAENLRSNAGVLVDAAIEMVKSLAQGVADSLPILLEKAPQIIIDFAGIINDNAPKLLAAALSIIKTLAEGLIKSIPVLVQNLPKIIEAIIAVFTAVNWINLGSNIIKSLSDGIKNMIPTVKAKGLEVLDALKGALLNLPKTLKTIGSQAVSFLATGIKGMATTAVAALKAIATSILTTVKSLPSQFLQLGKDIVFGLIKGISSLAGGAVSAISDVGSSVIAGVKGVFDIHSPSKVMQWVGEMLTEGLIVGVKKDAAKLTNTIVQPVTDAQKQIKNSGLAKNLSATIKQAKETAVNEAQSYEEIGNTMVSSIQTAIDENKDSALESIQSIIDDTVEAMEDGEQKDAAKAAGDDIIKSYQEALESGAENAKDYVSESISAITDEFQAQYDDLLSKQQALEETLGGTYLFEVEDGSVFVEDVQSSIDALKDYQTALEELQQRGASAALLDEVARFDTEEGLAVMQNLLGMTDEDFELLNEKWAEKQELAREVAESFYKDQMDALETEFNQRLMDELNAVPDEVYDIGRTSIEEWILGMNDKLPSLENKAREMAQRAIQAMKDELGIESPSKEGVYVGEMMNAGVVKGIDNSAKDVENAVQRMGFFEKAKSMIPSIQSAVTSSMASFAPMPAYAGGFGGRTETVQTINRNTVQTVEVVANGSGIFDVVVSEGKRRGKSLVTGKGL